MAVVHDDDLERILRVEDRTVSESREPALSFILSVHSTLKSSNRMQ